MAGRTIFDPAGFHPVFAEGKAAGFSFRFKLQYYRGITLSIIRDIAVTVDGKKIPRENIRLTIHGETFTLEETRTVVSSLYRWEFGEYADVTVLVDGGIGPGLHQLEVLQHIAPSYMPFPIMADCKTAFSLGGNG